MKYTYAYKTSDGTRHEASMEAESREAVFATLRQMDIKAIKVVAADGSKANGEVVVRGIRKRALAASVFVAAAFAGACVYFFSSGALLSNGSAEKIVARPLPRQVIDGDRKRVESAARSLTLKAEAFLARFAEPGREALAPESDWPTRDEFAAALKHEIIYSDAEYTEQIDLKRMVVWLKNEYSAYVRGGGYTSGYIRELISRQKMEIDRRVEHEKQLMKLIRELGIYMDHKKLQEAYTYWLKANAQLHTMGIYPLPLPYQLQSYQGELGMGL